MTRDQHLAFCRERAREYVNRGELHKALASMGSDLMKHDETRALATDKSTLLGMHAAMTNDAVAMRQWIDSFK